MRTVAILPVKSFSEAKQRLGGGLSPDLRRWLAEVMFTDVLTALRRSAGIDEVVVVTAGDRAQAIALEHGASVVEDEERGQNAAASLGIEAAFRAGAHRALLVPGDCPAIEPGELEGLLARPVHAPSVLVVPDRHGTGTNALLLMPPDAIEPAFGPGSCARHMALARAAGAEAEIVEVPSLALDVDTPEDLEELTTLPEYGVRTNDLLSRC